VPSNEQRREAAKRKLERQLANRVVRARKRRIVGMVSTVVGVVVVVGLVYWLVNLNSDDSTVDPAAQSTPPGPELQIPTELAPAPKRPTALPAKATCAYPATADKPASKPTQPPPTTDVSAEGTAKAVVVTTVGEIAMTLDRALAPCTVNSFLSLAKQGYFNDTRCHRLTTGASLQVLQCGDPSGTGSGGPGYSFDNEVYPELKYGRGILAMANAGSAADGKGTNGSQFFIVYGNAELPPEYSAFGTIDADSVGRIDTVARAGLEGGSPNDGPPKTEVTIKEIK